MTLKINAAAPAVKLHGVQTPVRSGGEKRPFEYPHLYQIQAGDWRISYAVEHNRLAILVLEVLTPEGSARKDPAADKLNRKMKVKLLDWPEGVPSRDLPPEELGKKIKIKFMDLAEELDAEGMASNSTGSSRGAAALSTRSAAEKRITFLDSPIADEAGSPAAQAAGMDQRKVTPLDSPTV
jgi:hypothetical protein